MLDIKFIRENTELVREAIKLKNISFNLDDLLRIDRSLKSLKLKEQNLKTQKNVLSDSIVTTPKNKREELVKKSKMIGSQIIALKPEIFTLTQEFMDQMYRVPNIPSPLAPIGSSHKDNVEIKKWGKKGSYNFDILDHRKFLETIDGAEFDKVADICGSRSYALKNDMILLEWAVQRAAVDILRSKGFTLFSMPSFAREKSLLGTGHFPMGKEQVYSLNENDLYLSGTGEVQLNSLYADEMIMEEKLPLLLGGISTCFRKESGSYGRDVRGLIRVHEFTKVEQFIICKNDRDEAMRWHQFLLEISEEIVQALELPYRIIECCTGDMGMGKVRMYDLEVWLPSEKRYRETHSCSNLHDWQARRTRTRFKDRSGHVHYCFTLNNTAIATPRILAPFLEVHQREDLSLFIPKILRPYLDGKERLFS